MDGGPVKNETIPIRMFLKPYDLTPTYESVNNQFSVRYYINLVLEDTEKNKGIFKFFPSFLTDITSTYITTNRFNTTRIIII